jgi:mannose-6-phosphate isomerase-like protein (cupin superfamily)
MNNLIDWHEHAGADLEKFYKSTLWQSANLMIGLNCLEPGQVQKVHAHQEADKIYFVLEGHGRFSIGDRDEEAGAGMLVVSPAGVPHGVTNTGAVRLSLLVAIAPAIKLKKPGNPLA